MKRSHAIFLAMLLSLCPPLAAAAVDVEFKRAIQYGSVNDVKAAVARGTNLAQRDDFGNTPLHWAAEAQRGEKVRALLDAGMDVNARNKFGETPLHRVIDMDARWMPAIEALLERKGLDLEVADERGRTTLYLASELPDLARAKRLLAMGAKDSIHAAALRGEASAVVRAIEDGIDVNAADSTGATPLLLAARRGHVELIRLLAGRGGKIDMADPQGLTPLMAAAHAGQIDAVGNLLDLGADLNLTDRGEYSFIDYAIIRIRDRNGHEHEKADDLAQRVLANPRAKPPLRAVALLRQADVALDGKNPQQAEALYRRAVAESPRSRAGINAAFNLARLLKVQNRHASAAETLIPLLVEDVNPK